MVPSLNRFSFASRLAIKSQNVRDFRRLRVASRLLCPLVENLERLALPPEVFEHARNLPYLAPLASSRFPFFFVPTARGG